MISDDQVRWIALFFLFSSMDENVAIDAAQKAIAQLKASDSISRVSIIRVARKILDQYHKSPQRNRATVIPEEAWILPDHVDVSAWAKFQKDASAEQVAAVVLSKILGFSYQDIAEGLGISLGTARYRVGKGVRQLGLVMKGVGR